jgi:hypothetical protein
VTPRQTLPIRAVEDFHRPHGIVREIAVFPSIGEDVVLYKTRINAGAKVTVPSGSPSQYFLFGAPRLVVTNPRVAHASILDIVRAS